MTQTKDYEFRQDKRTQRVHSYRVLQTLSYRGRFLGPGRIVQLRPNVANEWVRNRKVEPLAQSQFVNVMVNKIPMPERVIILGSGPNGVEHYGRIGPGDFVIACNAGVNCPVDHVDFWGAMDPTLYKQAYFSRAAEKLYRFNLDLSMEARGHGYPIPVFEKTRVAVHFPWVKCTFDLRKELIMTLESVDPHPRYVRPGATIAGAMTQIAFWSDVKEVVYCGIDMFGDGYFDGTLHKQRIRKNTQWHSCRVFNAMIHGFEKKGIKFSSLSKTNLEVRVD